MRHRPSLFETLPDRLEGIQGKAEEVDDAVQDAYRAVAGQLVAEELEQLDGVSDTRYAAWAAVLTQDGPANLKAAMTGYVIEDHASAAFAGDDMVALQVSGALRNSRPDVVITDGDEVGYVDVTSTRGVGHVFDKKGDWSRQNYVAESLYPTIDFSNLALGPQDLDEGTLEMIEEWKKTRAARAWKRVQKAYQSRLAEFTRDQVQVVKDLRKWSSDARRQLRPQQTGGGKMRRTRPYRGFDEHRTGRDIDRMRARMRSAGVSIDEDGRVQRRSFDEVLDSQGVIYTEEDVMEAYGL